MIEEISRAMIVGILSATAKHDSPLFFLCVGMKI